MVWSKVGNILAGHGATLFSTRQSHVASSCHFLHGKHDSSHESDFWWYKLCAHSAHGLLSVQDSGADYHAGSLLTLLGVGWHLPNVVLLCSDVDLLPPSWTLNWISFNLNQALPTDSANCKDSIYNNPKLVLGLITKGPNNKFVERGYKRTRLTSKEKRLNLTFLDGLTQILRSISPWNKLSSLFHKIFF